MREPERLLVNGATDFERELLASVKDERPSAELQQRMEQALGLPSNAALPAPSPTAAPVLPPAGGVLGGGVQAVALKVLLGLVVAGGLSYAVASLTMGEGEPSSSPPSARPQGRPLAAPPPERPLARERRPVTRAPEKAGSVPSEAKMGSTQGPAEAEKLPERAREPATADNLRVEIELLDAVRAAASRGQSKLAEDALERYDKRFPQGVLQREADMLRRAGVRPGAAAPAIPWRGAHPEAASGR